ncbi:MAG: PAS domain S-box protein [Desulfomonilia bacterium]
MKDDNKTNQQLIEELSEAHRRIAELENSVYEGKRMEEAMKGSEERYRILAENAHDLIWVFDLNFGYTYVSPSVKHLKGYTVEEAMKLKLHEVLTPDSYTKAMEILTKERFLEEAGQRHGPDWSKTIELEMFRKDGSKVWTEVTLNLLYNEKGWIKGIMGITRDISERKQVEEALRASEAKYHRLYDSMTDAFVSTDMDGQVKEYNETYRNMLGYKPEEISALTYSDLTPEKWHALEADIVEKQVLQRGYSDIYEKEYRKQDGTVFPVELRMFLLKDDGGKPTGMWAIVRDITGRRQAEEELKDHRDHLEDLVKDRTLKLTKANEKLKLEIEERKQIEKTLKKSDEKYRSYFSLTDDVMFSYDSQFRVLSVSPNVERVLGYKPEELVGKYFQDLTMLLHPEDVGDAFDNALHVLSGKTIYTNIYRFITKDGEVKFGEANGVPIIRDGRVVAMITVARDITKRIEMENSLQESEERYRITLQSMPDAVSIIKIKDMRYLYVNDTFCKITGYSFEETIGKTPFDLNLSVSSEDFDYYIKLIKNDELVDSLECQCRTKEGNILDTLVSARAVHYSGEDGMVMVMTDITALIEIKEEKKRLEIQTQKMESIGTLASGIAHDFNDILTTIIGYTKMSMKDIMDLTRGDKDLNVVHADLNEVRKAAIRARDLVNQILAFSRHAEKEYVPVVLDSTIRESLKMLRPSLPANIKIREMLAPSGQILGDPAQIHQVMTNLCTNAAHAMGETGGELEVSLQRVFIDSDAALNLDVPPGPYLRMTVRDTGHGMTSKVIARIYDPYFTTKWKGHGTGLGLSIVHGIVKSHGGAISCKSAPGQGTAFDIYLPELGFKREVVEDLVEMADMAGNERILNLDEELPRVELMSKEKADPGTHVKDRNKRY